MNDPGKISRALLPEHRLARIWKETLQVGQVAPDSDFFESGGDSLLATILAVRLKGEFGIKVDVQAIIDHPTFLDLLSLLASVPATHSPEGLK